MDDAIISVKDAVKYMPPVKARAWREIMKFEAERKDLKSEDAVDKYCEVIAKVFGITIDEVLDNLELQDVLPTYYAILNRIVAMLTEKLVADKKNEDAPAEN